MVIEKKIGFGKYFIYTLLVFLFIYQFRLEVIGLPPQIHSTRIGALGIVLLGIFTKGRSNRNIYRKVGLHRYLWQCAFLLLYSYVLIAFYGRGVGIHIIDVILNNLIFTIPVIWALTSMIEDIDTFFKILIFVGILQSVFIILCLINEPLQLIIDNTFNNVDSETHNILILRRGYAGGIGCITADGMIRFSISLLASSYLYVKKNNGIYLLLFIFFAILNAMIARTGLIIDVCCFIFITSQVKGRKRISQYMIFLLFIVILLYLILGTGKYDLFLEERFHRFSMLKETGLKADFFDGYFGGDIPLLQNNFIVGTGILSGISADGTVVKIDGGPLRIYSAIGFLFTICVYVNFLIIMFKNICNQNRKIDKNFMSLLLVFFMIADFKEITFFIVWPLSIYFTVAVLLLKSSSLNKSVDL